MPDEFDAAYWESRYHSHAAHGSRPPNLLLVAEAGKLAPGTALDAGCGEGGNALWLAERSWRVTAVDISPTALRRAREHAESHGADVADRIDWVEADLTAWEPPREHFDLVTAHYVHPAGSRQELLRRLAAAVALSGTLFVVEHDHSDEHAHTHSSADQLAASLDPQVWEIEVADTRVRRDTDPHGNEIIFHDAVLRARKGP
jgi:SAM-dependent methyltransferase